jgi:TPR repeat protein
MNYQISRDGSDIGTFSHLEIMKGFMDGTFLPTDHYWRSGMAGWKPLVEFRLNEQSPISTPPPAVSVNTTVSFKTKIIKLLWVLFAVFMPYFGAWRIIFDKSLGFSKAVKIGFTIYLAFIMTVFVSSSLGESKEKRIAGVVEESRKNSSLQVVENAATLIDSDKIDDRRRALKLFLEAGRKGDIPAQVTLIDIYKNGKIDGQCNIIDTYAWVKILATTHHVGSRDIEGRVSRAAEDAQWELDEYQRKGVVISKQKQIQLVSTIMNGVEPDRTVTTVDGISDDGGQRVADINSAKSTLEKLKQQLSPASISAGEKQIYYINHPGEKEAEIKRLQTEVKKRELAAKNDEIERAREFHFAKVKAEEGDPDAEFDLGFIYSTGDNGRMPKDHVEAVKWYLKAANKGHVKAQYYLGLCCYKGEGTPQDTVLSYAFLDVAGNYYEPARKELSKVQKDMTDAQIMAGQKRSRELQKEIEANIAKKAGK